MKYKVIVDFRDLQDAGYQYKVGDVYPHDGKPNADRVKHLMTPTTMRGALIAEVEETEKLKRKTVAETE